MSKKHKILVAYDSKSGNTKLAAQYVAEGVRENPNIEVLVSRVDEVDPRIFPELKGLIVGSPTYTGGMTAKVKAFLDEHARFKYPLTDAVGGAFATTLGSGAETTVIGILQSMMINKMIIVGPYWAYGRYGAMILGGKPKKEDDIKLLKMLGRRVADIVCRLYGTEEWRERNSRLRTPPMLVKGYKEVVKWDFAERTLMQIDDKVLSLRKFSNLLEIIFSIRGERLRRSIGEKRVPKEKAE